MCLLPSSQASLTAVALGQLDVYMCCLNPCLLTPYTRVRAFLFRLLTLQASLTAVVLGQLDGLKGLPGGSEGLLDLVKTAPSWPR
jgi:hypothetical protein